MTGILWAPTPGSDTRRAIVQALGAAAAAPDSAVILTIADGLQAYLEAIYLPPRVIVGAPVDPDLAAAWAKTFAANPDAVWILRDPAEDDVVEPAEATFIRDPAAPLGSIRNPRPKDRDR